MSGAPERGPAHDGQTNLTYGKRAMRRVLPFPALLPCLLLSWGCLPPFLDDDPGMPAAADVTQLRQQLRTIMEQEAVPGMVVGYVTRDGRSFKDALGHSDRKTGATMTVEMPFRAGSITKTLMGLAIMRQAEEGRVNLDAPLKTLLPEVAVDNPYEDHHPLQLVHLLEHTSGLDDTRPNEFIQAGHQAPGLLDVLAVNPKGRVSRWAPGTRHAYSNPGFTLAGAVLEQVTREPFEDHLQREILRPLGMTRATLRPDVATLDAMPQGYVGSAWLRPVDFHPILHRPAGSLVATVDDVLALARFFVVGGLTVDGKRLLSEGGLARVVETRSLQDVALPVGFAVGVQRWQVDGWLTVGHGGNVDGFSAMWAYLPEAGVGLAVLTNANNAYGAVDRVVQALVRHVLQGAQKPKPPLLRLTDEQRAAVTGFYVGACSRTVMLQFVDHLLGYREIHEDGDDLWLGGFGRTPQKLLALGNGQFRFEEEAQAGHVFRQKDGMLFSASRCFQKTARLPHLLERIFVFSVIPTVLSPLVVVPVALARQRRNGRRVHPEAWLTWLGAMCMLGCLVLLGTIKGIHQFHPPLNPRTVAFFVLPSMFAASGVVAAGLAAWRLRSEATNRLRVYTLVVGVMATAAAAYMAHWDQLGLMLWRF